MEKINFALLFIFSISVVSLASEMVIVDVHRTIPLSDDEPAYKDYAISTTDTSALKKHLVVNVKRRLQIKDASTKSVGEVETTVGQVRIIHVDKKVAIAREYKLVPRDEEVALDQVGIMTGDTIDLAGSFTDSKPIPVKKKDREPSSAVQTEKIIPLLVVPAEASKLLVNPLAIPEI